MVINKRLEIVVIFTVAVLSFFCLYSINEKISQKYILNKTWKYVSNSANKDTITVEEKITYNNRLYVFYSCMKPNANNPDAESIGLLQFQKNFLGWLCKLDSSSTDDDLFIQYIDSVKGSSASLIYGKNIGLNFKNLKIKTKEKTITKDISHKTHYFYLEEISKDNVEEIKLN
ncbi:hypothetical protein SAMN02745248_01978 [Hathewaya proteolytica DSM 3090]|uniref:Uncharacterized protein n=1 Tax=Hathewaya proteolytica DSM 3090 TaxID=1121331 RepID=A0A1M6QDL7_9CLOT|nr:hypothetical protein [Hathewaya proteolytica]SHK18167.1 hypothetical protein SAMN02745248_01978 [Hathewaya proteolytica DSM 3090]